MIFFNLFIFLWSFWQQNILKDFFSTGALKITTKMREIVKKECTKKSIYLKILIIVEILFKHFHLLTFKSYKWLPSLNALSVILFGGSVSLVKASCWKAAFFQICKPFSDPSHIQKEIYSHLARWDSRTGTFPFALILRHDSTSGTHTHIYIITGSEGFCHPSWGLPGSSAGHR